MKDKKIKGIEMSAGLEMSNAMLLGLVMSLAMVLKVKPADFAKVWMNGEANENYKREMIASTVDAMMTKLKNAAKEVTKKPSKKTKK